jgi:murein DD-endopeptidase MepM/ murein hydrolase activator NlpD
MPPSRPAARPTDRRRRARIRIGAVITAVAVATALHVAIDPVTAGAVPPCLLPPVSAPVVDAFREPACPYCPGNRGLELAPALGSVVIAAAPGRVSFAGSVAGVHYVVVEHGSGHRTTYGRLASMVVRAGAAVSAGVIVGISSDRLFFGLRLGEHYLDPAPYLATVRPRPQLVPLDGRNRRPPRSGAVTCPPGSGGWASRR